MLTHGYLPDNFMKFVIVAIIKNKIGNTSNKDNYRLVVIVTAASKLFEIVLHDIVDEYLVSWDNQFGLRLITLQNSTFIHLKVLFSTTKTTTVQSTHGFRCINGI